MKSTLSYLPLASGFLVLVLSLAVGVLTVTSRANPNQNLSTKASESNASLSLSPINGTYDLTSKVTYPVGIIMDSGGKAIDGVDVVISYDPAKVKIVDSTVTSASVFENIPANSAAGGKIRFSGLTFNAKPVSGIIGTFRIQPIAKGNVEFSFEFTPGSTTDSNIADHASAQDILGKVTNAKFTIK